MAEAVAMLTSTSRRDDCDDGVDADCDDDDDDSVGCFGNSVVPR